MFWIYFSGALGILANVLIYQQKSSQKLIIFKLMSDVIWLVHYFLLAAYTATAIALIGVVREIAFYKKSERKFSNNTLLIIFVACSIASAVFTWSGYMSLLPAAASVISVISFWRKSPRLSRLLAFPISICMLTYDIFCLSYMGIANEIFTLSSTTISTVRYKNENKDKKA